MKRSVNTCVLLLASWIVSSSAQNCTSGQEWQVTCYQCPSSHPYHYQNGNYCCQFNLDLAGFPINPTSPSGNCKSHAFQSCSTRPCIDYNVSKTCGVCVNCPPGKFKASSGTQSCQNKASTCPAGQGYSNGTTTTDSCSTCTSGKYSTANDKSPCATWTSCPNGVASSGSSTSDNVCQTTTTTAEPTAKPTAGPWIAGEPEPTTKYVFWEIELAMEFSPPLTKATYTQQQLSLLRGEITTSLGISASDVVIYYVRDRNTPDPASPVSSFRRRLEWSRGQVYVFLYIQMNSCDDTKNSALREKIDLLVGDRALFSPTSGSLQATLNASMAAVGPVQVTYATTQWTKLDSSACFGAALSGFVNAALTMIYLGIAAGAVGCICTVVLIYFCCCKKKSQQVVVVQQS